MVRIKKNNEDGFTLVELLAVIVILAIILVIAVPKVISVITNSKNATLESTARMIAGTAEKQKIQNTLLGKTEEITCESIVKLNDADYEDCDIEFDGNTAKVTIKGSGKFEGINVCNGTKTNSSVVNISCSEVCDINEELKVYNIPKPYEVDDVNSCVSILQESVKKNGYTHLYSSVEPLCNGQTVEDYNFDSFINLYIGLKIFTEEELVESKVIKEIETEELKVCMPTTSINAVTHLNNMVKDENARKTFGLKKDDTADKNIRYTGRTPSNKVYFNCASTDGTNAYGSENYNYASSCEIWRIIGVFNVKSSENGTPLQRIKIVRDEMLSTTMAWDTESDGINAVNQWGETTLTSDNKTVYPGASLKQYLNDGEDSYYNSLSSIAKDQIGDAVWNTGAVESVNPISKLDIYNQERGILTGSNAAVNYTTTWKGKIGLIYISDFAYAGNLCGDICNSLCEQNNWLLEHYKRYWTLTRNTDIYGFPGYLIAYSRYNGFNFDDLYEVRPALYLDSNVQVIGGNGNSEPYKLKA